MDCFIYFVASRPPPPPPRWGGGRTCTVPEVIQLAVKILPVTIWSSERQDMASELLVDLFFFNYLQ